MQLIECEMNRIILNEKNDQQVIYLKDKNSERNFPIIIGMYEAWTINNTLKGLQAPRPLTHDLIVNIISGLGAKLKRVVITKLEEGTFFAIMEVEKDGEIHEIDSRPSDAIAISMKLGAPIFVAENVINEATPPF